MRQAKAPSPKSLPLGLGCCWAESRTDRQTQTEQQAKQSKAEQKERNGMESLGLCLSSVVCRLSSFVFPFSCPSLSPLSALLARQLSPPQPHSAFTLAAFCSWLLQDFLPTCLYPAQTILPLPYYFPPVGLISNLPFLHQQPPTSTTPAIPFVSTNSLQPGLVTSSLSLSLCSLSSATRDSFVRITPTPPTDLTSFLLPSVPRSPTILRKHQFLLSFLPHL